jgi:hypothetical protein
MTTTTMSAQRTIFNTIKSLFAPAPQAQRYGHTSFVVGDNGEYQHVATAFTEKRQPRETEEAFVARVEGTYREPGDRIEFFCEAGSTVTARITRQPRT